MAGISRRGFIGSGGVIALVPAGEAAAQRRQAPGGPGAQGAQRADAARDTYLFFNPAEAKFIEAATLRLIPPDAVGPSALEAGVPWFIDRQLHGAWGAGERLYKSGPWQPGAPTQGYQLPYTPAELYRTALRGIAALVQRERQTSFERLDGDAQDTLLTEWQTKSIDLGGVPSNVFFESLLAMTIEGYFGDPVYGGNRGMAAWSMIGFPGSYGSYYDWVERHGEAFPGAPRSLAENGQGHVHVMPNMPIDPKANQPGPTAGRSRTATKGS